MSFDIQALLDLWTTSYADPAEAADAFRILYADPVVVMGGGSSGSGFASVGSGAGPQ